MYARRVLLKERFHYANNGTFTNGTTKALKASAGTWTVTNNGSGIPYITSPAAGTYRNLMNTRTFTPSTVTMFEFHGKTTAGQENNNGTNGFGMLFQADAPAGSTTEEYRLRQCADKLLLEKANPAWTTNASWAVAAGDNIDYFYRIYYAQSAYTLYNWATPFTAGAFFIFRGTTQENMTYIGTTNDTQPLTGNGYIGLYKGSGATLISQHMGAYRLWDMDTQSVEWSHEADKDSTAIIELARDPDTLSTSDTVNDRWEVWAPEFNGSTNTENLYLVFDGSLEREAQKNQRVLALEGWSREMKDLQWFVSNSTNGTTLSTLRTQLASGGGQFSTNTSANATRTHVLHSNGLDTSITDESNRYIQGKSMDVTFKQLLLEVGGFYFYHPDGRFWVRKSLVTGPATIDTTSQYLNLINYEIWKDGRQIVNTSEGYYDGYTTPSTKSNGTSQGFYGIRDRAHIDMLQKDSTYMGNAQLEYLNEHARNDYIFKLDLGQSHFNFFPGMAVNVKLAGTLFGTNGGSNDTSTWVAEKCTLFKTHYSSSSGIHSLYFTYNGTLADATKPVLTSYPPDMTSSNRIADVLKQLGSMDT